MNNQRIDRSQSLGTASIPKLIFSFFITALVGLVLNSVYNLTDTLFIARGIGDVAMGGVSIVLPFVIFQGAISTMIGSGAATIVAIKLGKKQYDQAGQYTFNAMILFYSIAIFLSVVFLIFIDEFLALLGAQGEIFNYAKDYLIIILIGNVFSTGFSSIVRAEGKIVFAMLMWIVPIVLNIALDAVFIIALGWGVKGAAAATIISQFTSFAMCVLFFTRFSSQTFKHLSIKFKHMLAVAKIGLPTLIQVSGFSIITAIMNMIISRMSGDTAIIAFGYMSKLIYYFMAPFMAFAQAISPIISYNYGQNNSERVRKTLAFSIMCTIAYGVIVLVFINIIPQYLMMIFTNNADIVAIGAGGMRIVALSLIFMPIPLIIGAKYQATGKTITASIMQCLSFVTVIAPAILLSKYYGLNGLWISYSLAHAISTLIVIIGLSISKWIKTKQNNSPIEQNYTPLEQDNSPIEQDNTPLEQDNSPLEQDNSTQN